MGASTDYRKYPASLGINKIKEMWAEAVESDLYENGHSYSGTIGMLGPQISKFYDPPFEGEDAYQKAYEFIDTNHQKWKPAIAVSYIDDKGKMIWLVGGWCSS